MGVIYDEPDYAGTLLRISIMLVDLIVVIFFYVIAYLIDDYLYDAYYTNSFYNAVYIALLISFLYLTLLKASKIGTVGQMVTGTKILNINGKKPSLFSMTYRLLFWVVGPVNFIADLAWVSLNKEKRTLRDSLCNTIVVKKKAIPISNNEIKKIRVMALGFHFLYRSAAN
jgi:uncharacterized RDD family membrane protein YckC